MTDRCGRSAGKGSFLPFFFFYDRGMSLPDPAGCRKHAPPRRPRALSCPIPRPRLPAGRGAAFPVRDLGAPVFSAAARTGKVRLCSGRRARRRHRAATQAEECRADELITGRVLACRRTSSKRRMESAAFSRKEKALVLPPGERGRALAGAGSPCAPCCQHPAATVLFPAWTGASRLSPLDT